MKSWLRSCTTTPTRCSTTSGNASPQYRLFVQTFDDVARLVAELHGYNAYLVKLDQVTAQDLKEALVDGWLAMAPPQVAEGFLSE